MMENELAISEQAGLPAIPALPRLGPRDLYGALLAEATKKTTLRARTQDADAFAKFLRTDPASAFAAFVSQDSAGANAIALAFKASMLEAALSPATINRRMSTLRKAVKLARRFSLVGWTLEIDSLKTQSYRDTSGPGRAGWVRLLSIATAAYRRGSAKGLRDMCILRLLHDHGLRRFEVAGLDLADWDPNTCRLALLGKGQGEKIFITVNSPTTIALENWVKQRGDQPGPLFCRLDKARAKEELQRLDDHGVYYIVRQLGKEAGLLKPVKPHGLRHQGITRVLELNNGNVDAAQKFARHRDPKTTQRYNDNRTDLAGSMAKLLGDDV